MRYVSTRGQAPVLDFEGVTLTGLASDGGLYLPQEWPQFSHAEIAALRGLPYPELAVRIMAPFVGDSLTEQELRDLCAQAYGTFSHAAVTPLVQLDERHWLLELFHGPTLAFKDVALQLLGLLFETFLARRDRPLTIVGATSGDTGSAAIHAVAGRKNVEIFMLHPEGRVSEIQRRQMTTVSAANVHNIAIAGSFDDAQAMVKRMFADSALTDTLDIGAVNSINWARLMAQVVYYFYAALQLGAPDRKVSFSVPTGNFGDVFAGYVAAHMGLPVERLIVATNKNDILARAIRDGDYSVGESHATITPSMDIQVSSNFERLLFEANGRDAAALAAQMDEFASSKTLPLELAQREAIATMFSAERATPEQTLAAMRWAHESCGEVIDPHTAVGLHAARELAAEAAVPVVTLATAHPAKFPDAVKQAIGIEAALPARVGDLFALEERFETLPADYDAVRDYISARATR
ncbi:threonine synthase [Citromicrobium sp. WPS32]|uniref:threonine synthase n=1 Tax=Citromicrobium sp. WPS32 TaxID=1634517 RepID=UPI0006C8FF64|nr:threonine synthase [Citromicrobium sp. WPS32]KPM15627.1 threonine synthase [Citromicrobium sp. WPS32]|tara:strand:+ start:2883 stop:4277 length:1395 start_codon:yes stop_codon:yes gene_type:complete